MSNTKPRKLTVVRKPNEPLRLEQGEEVHVGVDFQKASSSVALFSDRRGLIATWVQPARAEVLIERLPVAPAVAARIAQGGPVRCAHGSGPTRGRRDGSGTSSACR